jgi:hypothetical protein
MLANAAQRQRRTQRFLIIGVKSGAGDIPGIRRGKQRVLIGSQLTQVRPADSIPIPLPLNQKRRAHGGGPTLSRRQCAGLRTRA